MKNLLIFIVGILPFLCQGQIKIEYVIDKNDTLSVVLMKHPNGEFIGGAYAYKAILESKIFNDSSPLKFTENDSMIIVLSQNTENLYSDTFKIMFGENLFSKDMLGEYLFIVEDKLTKDSVNNILRTLVEKTLIQKDSLNNEVITLQNNKTVGFDLKNILLGLLGLMCIILLISYMKLKKDSNKLKSVEKEKESEESNVQQTDKAPILDSNIIKNNTIETNEPYTIKDENNELKAINLFLSKVNSILNRNKEFTKQLSNPFSSQIETQINNFEEKHANSKSNWEKSVNTILANKPILDNELKRSIEGISLDNEKIRIIKNKLYVEFLINYVNDTFILLEEFRVCDKLNSLTDLTDFSQQNEKNINELLRDVKEKLSFELYYVPSLSIFNSKDSKRVKLLDYNEDDNLYNDWLKKMTGKNKGSIIVKIVEFGNSFNNSKTTLLIK